MCLAHRGSRLSDAQALASRGPDWAREIARARAYLSACERCEIAEHQEKEAALVREKERLAEIAAAQARTARLQRITRWAFAQWSGHTDRGCDRRVFAVGQGTT